MKTRAKVWVIAIGFLVAAGLIVDVWSPVNLVSSEIEARVGRPLTPVSVAGVSRRTRRRTIRRSTIYVASLPQGCTTVVIEGQSCQQCGDTYYQADGTQYVVVYVEEVEE
jgi:YgiT-type zinc finger domain-containing protein